MRATKTVLIAGPTASGKSAVALALAQATGGVVVNADSMQVYRELRLLSARPSADEEALAPHRLFGIVSVLEPFSVARWLAAARAALSEIHEEGRLAIVVGGTGLYFKALTQGLVEAPESDPALRAAARARREALGVDAFHAELVALDPEAAVLSPGDTQRTLRAWEVVTQTGRGLSSWAREQAPADAEGMAGFVMTMARPDLYARIDRRFDAMMAEGALEEARAFWSLGPSDALPSAKALGLPQLKRALDGEISLDAAVAEAKMLSRRYAKRQDTWFRHQTPDWTRLAAADGAGRLADFIRASIGR